LTARVDPDSVGAASGGRHDSRDHQGLPKPHPRSSYYAAPPYTKKSNVRAHSRRSMRMERMAARPRSLGRASRR
jgi:hypothetical protein